MSDLVQALRKRLELDDLECERHMRVWFQEQVDANPKGGSATIAQLTRESARHENARLAPLHELLLRVVEAAEEIVTKLKGDRWCGMTAAQVQNIASEALSALREAVK